jgi:hypothetical protein
MVSRDGRVVVFARAGNLSPARAIFVHQVEAEAKAEVEVEVEAQVEVQDASRCPCLVSRVWHVFCNAERCPTRAL